MTLHDAWEQITYAEAADEDPVAVELPESEAEDVADDAIDEQRCVVVAADTI